MAVKKEETPDARWLKLQTENAIPDLTIGELVFTEASAKQIAAWRAATSTEEGEKALWGEELYVKVHEVFDDLPNHVWENFNILYLKHFFGTDGEEDLKG